MAKYVEKQTGRQDLPVADRQLASLNAINQAKSEKATKPQPEQNVSTAQPETDVQSGIRQRKPVTAKSRSSANSSKKVNTTSDTLTFRMPGYVKDRIRAYIKEVQKNYDPTYSIRTFFFDALEALDEAYPEFGEGMTGEWPVSKDR